MDFSPLIHTFVALDSHLRTGFHLFYEPEPGYLYIPFPGHRIPRR